VLPVNLLALMTDQDDPEPSEFLLDTMSALFDLNDEMLESMDP
jgi:hypothetical protein